MKLTRALKGFKQGFAFNNGLAIICLMPFDQTPVRWRGSLTTELICVLTKRMDIKVA